MDYFTSDHHLGHLSILQYTEHGAYLEEYLKLYPIALTEHDQWIVDTLNSYVKPKDNLWLLGDISTYKKYEALSWIEKINGHKRLVLGNHDFANTEVYKEASSVFDSVEHYAEIKLNNKRIIMSHYPIAEWNSGHHGSWHLHGHCHGSFDYKAANLHDKRILDVGWDSAYKILGEYRPFSFSDIEKYMEGRVSISHHGKTKQ